MVKYIFKDFAEFWCYTKMLSERQRDVVFHSLPVTEQNNIKKSYRLDGWEDLFIRNEVDTVLDKIKTDIGLDVIYIRSKVLMGKTFYMKKNMWDYIYDSLKIFPEEHTSYAIGGIFAKKVNKQAVRIVRVKNGKK